MQYFLETERDELEYEAARRRPLLTPDFFAHLTRAIGQSWCWCSLLVKVALEHLSVRLRIPCQLRSESGCWQYNFDTYALGVLGEYLRGLEAFVCLLSLPTVAGDKRCKETPNAGQT